MGSPLPMVGAETRTCRSTMRPGTGNMTGLIEKTGVAEGMGMLFALPIKA